MFCYLFSCCRHVMLIHSHQTLISQDTIQSLFTQEDHLRVFEFVIDFLYSVQTMSRQVRQTHIVGP